MNALLNRLRKAYIVHPIAALQNEYSLLTRDIKQRSAVNQRAGCNVSCFFSIKPGLVTNTLNVTSLEERVP